MLLLIEHLAPDASDAHLVYAYTAGGQSVPPHHTYQVDLSRQRGPPTWSKEELQQEEEGGRKEEEGRRKVETDLIV
eukprot:COSAG02_NODE_25616_length_653_cov_1.052347_1_plen_76_part_00